MFVYVFNYNSIKPEVLDGGHEIILPNLSSERHFACSKKNDIPF